MLHIVVFSRLFIVRGYDLSFCLLCCINPKIIVVSLYPLWFFGWENKLIWKESNYKVCQGFAEPQAEYISGEDKNGYSKNA